MLSALYAIARPGRPSVRLSVSLSVRLPHGWIIGKWLKLGLWNFHHTVPPCFYFCEVFYPQILRGPPPERERQTMVRWVCGWAKP